MAIHPTAVVESGAVLGHNVEIGPFSYVANHTHIGDHCHLGSHVTILPYTTLGSGCQVHAGAVIGDLPQDLSFHPGDVSYVKIGQNTVLREGVTVNRGTKPGTVTTIGNDCLLMANSHVGHNCTLGDRVIMTNGSLAGGYVEIGDRAFISGNCMIHQFVRIGRLVMMSGGSAASKDVPPFCMTQSSATSTLMGLNSVGLRRAGVDGSDRKQIKDAFKLLFCSGLPTTTAIEKLQNPAPSPLVQELCEFIASSERGVCKFFKPVAHGAHMAPILSSNPASRSPQTIAPEAAEIIPHTL